MLLHTIGEKYVFATCFMQLKMPFVTILETTIIANNIFNHTKQVTKWSFSISNIMPMNTEGHIQYFSR
jgi:hypothetical protein